MMRGEVFESALNMISINFRLILFKGVAHANGLNNDRHQLEVDSTF